MRKPVFGVCDQQVRLKSTLSATFAINTHIFCLALQVKKRKHRGSVVECLTLDRGATGSSLTGVTVLCPWARHINPSLVLVQPRKTHPYITERLLKGRKESNQTNKTNYENVWVAGANANETYKLFASHRIGGNQKCS